MENSTVTIKLDELRAAVNAIIDHVTEDLGIAEIELTRDLYQEIPSDRLYEVGDEAVVPNVGSLADDLEFLEPLLRGQQQPTSIMLMHVAPLLRYVAQKIGQ